MIAFDDIIVDRFSNGKLKPIVTDLFTTGTKLNISLAFITQIYVALWKNIRLNSKYYFIIKILNKQGL